jgi:hypothetical protein
LIINEYIILFGLHENQAEDFVLTF